MGRGGRRRRGGGGVTPHSTPAGGGCGGVGGSSSSSSVDRIEICLCGLAHLEHNVLLNGDTKEEVEEEEEGGRRPNLKTGRRSHTTKLKHPGYFY